MAAPTRWKRSAAGVVVGGVILLILLLAVGFLSWGGGSEEVSPQDLTSIAGVTASAGTVEPRQELEPEVLLHTCPLFRIYAMQHRVP